MPCTTREKLRKRWWLFRELRKHRKLDESRSVNYSANRTAKYVVWFASSFLVLYLLFFAILFSFVANQETSVTGAELICGLSPFILALDFSMRFLSQTTPAQLVKPYILLPVSRYTVIDNLIGSSLITGANFLWFIMLVPYLFMSVLFVDGLLVSLEVLLFFYLLVLASSQFHLIVKTLVTDSVLWWLLPVAVAGIMLAPWYLNSGLDFSKVFYFYAGVGTTMEDGRPWPLLAELPILVLLVYVNRYVQGSHIMAELTHKAASSIHRVSSFGFFERYGLMGEYVKLEIKMNLRNKNLRKSLIAATRTVVLFSLIICLTDVYDSEWGGNFWCLYNYVVFSSMLSARIMAPEGNYLDFLMVHRENILDLLRVKFMCYSAMLLLPFVLMLPTVFMGKWSLLMLVSYLVFTIGFQYFLLFQLAVYNKETIPLNTKFTGRNGAAVNYLQIIVQLVAFGAPIGFVSLMTAFFDGIWAHLVMLLIGLVFIFTSNLWLRNIYSRMMRRKYILMEGFRSTR